MPDNEDNTEAEDTAKPEPGSEAKAETKPKAKAKAKAKPKAAAKAKPKAKAKTEPKAEVKTKTDAADIAPYKKSSSKTASTNTGKEKKKSSTSIILLMAVVVLIALTIYKFNEERSNRTVSAGSQENTPGTIATATVDNQVPPEATSNESTGTSSLNTPGQDMPLESKQIDEQFTRQVPEQLSNNEEMMQLRRQAYQKERLLRQQQNQAKMAAHRLEMAKAAEAQREEILRLRQSQVETRKQVQEMQEQIFALHEQIRQLLRQSHTRRMP